MQPGHLALPHIEDAGSLTSEHALFQPWIGRQQMLNPQVNGRQLGQKTVGGCGQHHQVPCIQMAIHQIHRRARNTRHDGGSQKRLAQRLPFFGRPPSQRSHVKVGELFKAHGADLVTGLHIRVTRSEGAALQHAFVNQEIAPQRITVARQQCVVEVEQRQLHALRKCQALGRVKVWMP